LTDVSNPRRLGPKRANKVRRLFNLKKKPEDKATETVVPLIKKSIIRRTFTGKDGKNRQKAAKI
jgi:small subunit ribosomal protein S6e